MSLIKCTNQNVMNDSTGITGMIFFVQSLLHMNFVRAFKIFKLVTFLKNKKESYKNL